MLSALPSIIRSDRIDLPITHEKVGVLSAANSLDDAKVVGDIGIVCKSGNICECFEHQVLLEDLFLIRIDVKLGCICDGLRHLDVALHGCRVKLLACELKA